MATEVPENENLYAVFGSTPMSSYEYVAPFDEPVESVNRTKEKDHFYEAVIKQRFDKNLYIITPVPAPVPAPIVEAPKPVIPPPKVYPTPSNLVLNGKPAVRETLRVSGWYHDLDSKGCSYEWLSGGQVVSTATNFYVVSESDQGKDITARVMYSGEHLEAAEASTSASVSIPAPVRAVEVREIIPELTDFRLEGGSEHTHPIVAVATYSDNLPHSGTYQWFRTENGNTYALNGFTEQSYTPSADDLLPGVTLSCQYTVQEGKNRGEIRTKEADPAFLKMDPKVAALFEAKIREKRNALFNVSTLDGRKLTLSINKKRVKTFDPNAKRSTTVRGKHGPFLVVALFRVQVNQFRVNFSQSQHIDLICADRIERDVIALTIRYFTGAKARSK